MITYGPAIAHSAVITGIASTGMKSLLPNFSAMASRCWTGARATEPRAPPPVEPDGRSASRSRSAPSTSPASVSLVARPLLASRPVPASAAITTITRPSGQAGTVLATTKELYGKQSPSSAQNRPLVSRLGLVRSRATRTPTPSQNSPISQ